MCFLGTKLVKTYEKFICREFPSDVSIKCNVDKSALVCCRIMNLMIQRHRFVFCDKPGLVVDLVKNVPHENTKERKINYFTTNTVKS